MHNDCIYIGMGANLGDPLETLTRAAEEILSLPDVADVRFSSLYRTSPVSALPQPDFLNAVSSFRCSLDPFDLQQHLMRIETKLGKQPKVQDAPRHIDLDILFYRGISLDSAHLILPHPRWRQRLFVLYPLKDLTETIFLQNEGEIDLSELIRQQDHQQQKIKIYQEYADARKQDTKENCGERLLHWPGRTLDDHHRSLCH